MKEFLGSPSRIFSFLKWNHKRERKCEMKCETIEANYAMLLVENLEWNLFIINFQNEKNFNKRKKKKVFSSVPEFFQRSSVPTTFPLR